MRKAWIVLIFVLLLGTGACSSSKKNTAMQQGPDQYKVRLQTTKGDVVLLVHRDWAPKGADHFYELTKMGFYNDDYFFRALKGFVVQWGLNGDPKLNKTWSEISIPDDPVKMNNRVGTVVFAATSQPNSRSTQVFINLSDNSQKLDSLGFAPFAEVIQGMENVQNFFMDYGEGAPQGNGPSQGAIAEVGNPYIEEHFPKLDRIKKAEILP